MKNIIYLDYNCFQRGFDDLRQIRIQMEALACQNIFLQAEAEDINLVWSFMHQDETLLCPFDQRKQEVLKLSRLCTIRIAPSREIYQLAQSFQQMQGLSSKDAVHVACGDYIKANFFLTCDDNLIKKSNKLNLAMYIMNPIDYIRQEEI
ncbi:hypothetical protein CwatDRAFT_1853 [Crocosphaera watsonii WH 8501]|uniref:PIN domain-containing protein n=6 Tax=Crocosphaera watsonii TaxID=263511 RepID=Q4BZ66_CROWT|nr:hypothetical protein CwatDRAFT_1853 [Crocosphaera watsonii WH 8501]NQZ62731.1 hypothetical protein [Crocosphaera sp.]